MSNKKTYPLVPMFAPFAFLFVQPARTIEDIDPTTVGAETKTQSSRDGIVVTDYEEDEDE